MKYGGETERGGRRVVRTWSESLAGLMRRYPTPLVAVRRAGAWPAAEARNRYLNDPRHRHRQAAHGSRFKVKFVRPSKGK